MELPDDVLAGVFRRLAPRSLAASRCVCKVWRDVIDAQRLLRADLLPHSVRGIFIKYQLREYPTFFSCPSTAVLDITGKLNFTLDRARSSFATMLDQNQSSFSTFVTALDHCNGLLLYQDECGLYVLNPATQQGACLPSPPCVDEITLEYITHLVFDPTESPHYQVFLVPDNPHRDNKIIKYLQENNTASTSITSGLTHPQQLSSAAVEGMEQPDVLLPVEGLIEWPPSTWVLCVFSSQTGRWKERAFTREGKVAGTVAEDSFWRAYAVYWLDALYIQYSEGKSIMRISLSNDKYRVIEMPSDQKFNGWMNHYNSYLGKSLQGVSLASFHDHFDLWIWDLDESCDQIKWVLRHKIDLVPTLCVLDYSEKTKGSWILQDFNPDADGNIPAVKENSFEWDSDNDDIIIVDYEATYTHSAPMGVLGFHPYKNVVFVNLGTYRAVAFHLNSLMIQDLGNLFPKDYEIAGWCQKILRAFPYTPCLMDFPENNLGDCDQDQHHL